MSASTMSIAANPTAALRRKPVVSGDRKSNLEFTLNGTTGNDADNGTEIHPTRVDAAIEKPSKDTTPAAKKSQNVAVVGNNVSVPQRRTRRSLVKPEKPRWRRALSVFVKNFLALLLMGGLFQIIRRSSNNPHDTLDFRNQKGFSDIEGRIAEAEGFVKKTAKMMQVQMEVLDRKFGEEVGGLRKEMQEKIDETNGKFNIELKNMEDRNERFEKALDELSAKDWLSKEEFESFYEDVKMGNIGPPGINDISLDKLRAYAREIVEKEIEKHAADGLGRVDYALASAGALVVKHSEPYVVGGWFKINSGSQVHKSAEKMLRPSFGEPGHCFPLKGNTGFVEIRLRTAIVPEAITLEHVAKIVAYDRTSAPKKCRVFGWLRGEGSESSMNNDRRVLLTEFVYDLDKTNAQTFEVLDAARSVRVDTIRFDFTSNHGNLVHTCIYRLRVHGHEIDSGSMVAAATVQP